MSGRVQKPTLPSLSTHVTTAGSSSWSRESRDSVTNCLSSGAPYNIIKKLKMTTVNKAWIGLDQINFWYFIHDLNPKIKIWILICCPYSFPTEVVGRSW